MAQTVLLNNVDHKDLCVITRRTAELGDRVMSAVTFPEEFRSIQAHYPIVFEKSADGLSFQPLALFGFEAGQNLFLDEHGWDASYLPMAIERQPFYIGRDGDGLTVHVDIASPRVSLVEGQPVFLQHGGSTEFLERMTELLLAIHEGVQATPGYVAALLEHRLLESFVLDIEGRDGAQYRLAGFYTIHEERLASLGDAAIASLHRAGHLMPTYMALASLSNFRALIERHQQGHGARR